MMFCDSKATERFTWIINSAMGISLWRQLLRSLISGIFFRLDVPISSSGMCRYRQLSICNRFSFFLPRFPDIPRKISAYLQTDSSSGANTRIIRGFYKILNINDLCLRGILSFCEKHRFVMRNGPFQGPKNSISHPNIGFFASWNGLFRKAKLIFSDYVTGYVKWWFWPKEPSSYRF